MLGKMLGYQKLEKFVSTVEVVNDCVERGIKLISDFKVVTKSQEQQQYVFQVVEAYRLNFPVFTKENLNKI
jgi:hypothetical protein